MAAGHRPVWVPECRRGRLGSSRARPGSPARRRESSSAFTVVVPYINSSSPWSSFSSLFCHRHRLAPPLNAAAVRPSQAKATASSRSPYSHVSPSQSPVAGHHRAAARGQPSPLPLYVFQLHRYTHGELLMLLAPSILAVTGSCRWSTACHGHRAAIVGVRLPPGWLRQ
jgi:hypothetical protein